MDAYAGDFVYICICIYIYIYIYIDSLPCTKQEPILWMAVTEDGSGDQWRDEFFGLQSFDRDEGCRRGSRGSRVLVAPKRAVQWLTGCVFTSLGMFRM